MGVIKTNKNPAIILCESNNDLNDLNDIFTSVDNVRIINIYASKNNDFSFEGFFNRMHRLCDRRKT